MMLLEDFILTSQALKYILRKQNQPQSTRPPLKKLHAHTHIKTHTCISKHTNKIRLAISSADKVLSQQINYFRFIGQTISLMKNCF